MTTQTEPEPAEKPKTFFDTQANLKALIRLIVIVAVLAGGVWLFVRLTAGKKTADTLTASVLRQPISLIDTIEDIPASSFKALPLSLPYAGTLLIEAAVKKGNDISVYVVAADQIEKIKAKQGFIDFKDFEAVKTKTYRRSARLPSGSYYLVLMDKTLGLLSQSSSDVQIMAKLEP